LAGIIFGQKWSQLNGKGTILCPLLSQNDKSGTIFVQSWTIFGLDSSLNEAPWTIFGHLGTIFVFFEPFLGIKNPKMMVFGALLVIFCPKQVIYGLLSVRIRP